MKEAGSADWFRGRRVSGATTEVKEEENSSTIDL